MRKRFRTSDVELGIMIETPAAVMMCEELAQEVDFFCVGTNDLTQYTLAIDRQNSKLDRFYNPHHAAVLRLIERVVKNAHAAGIWAGIWWRAGREIRSCRRNASFRWDWTNLSVSPGGMHPSGPQGNP